MKINKWQKSNLSDTKFGCVEVLFIPVTYDDDGENCITYVFITK